MLGQIADAGREAGIEVSVCGELASHPLGIYLLLGLGVTAFSVAPASLPEIKKVVRSIPASDARVVAGEALTARTTEEVTDILIHGIERWLDLSLFSGRWGISAAE
jgi:phosphoenolpyruvate-protein kinase (PTS system EI component)